MSGSVNLLLLPIQNRHPVRFAHGGDPDHLRSILMYGRAPAYFHLWAGCTLRRRYVHVAVNLVAVSMCKTVPN
ncbi:hypothetical protein D1872_328690 [compost metagenome]